MSRRKRASMREGPLSELFRSTSDDAPLDPPEAGSDPAKGQTDKAAGPVAAEGASGLTRPDAPPSTPPAENPSKDAPAPAPGKEKAEEPASAPAKEREGGKG